MVRERGKKKLLYRAMLFCDCCALHSCAASKQHWRREKKLHRGVFWEEYSSSVQEEHERNPGLEAWGGDREDRQKGTWGLSIGK